MNNATKTALRDNNQAWQLAANMLDLYGKRADLNILKLENEVKDLKIENLVLRNRNAN